MNLSRFVSLLLLALAVVAGGALWLQRQAAAELRHEIALYQRERDELAQLRAEHARLAALQLPADELARLRADHGVVIRLRGEIDALRASVQQRERALPQPAAAVSP